MKIPVLVVILVLLGTQASAVTNPGYRGLSYTERGILDVRAPGGVRINPHTGNLVLQRTLFFVPGKGLPVHFRLTYDSDHRLISLPFGFGWTLSSFERPGGLSASQSVNSCAA